MPYAINKGVKTYYEVTGEGPDFLMLHANPCDHRMWMYQVAFFSRRFRVIATDMRGYGRTDKPEDPYGFEALAEDAFAVCDQENITGGIIAGASMGSKIAFKMVLKRPGLFQAMIHVGGNAHRGTSYDDRAAGYLGADVPSYRAGHLAELFAPGFSETPRGKFHSKIVLDDSTALSGKAISTLFHSFDRVDLASQVSAINIPVQIVNGIHDNSLEGGRKTASLIDGARHEAIDNAGHLCCLEDPARFQDICVSFLRENGLYPGI
ncbi:MAG: alpha/beta hydrolase [Proteobacteria bacterium]|nr:alpha/beta hydrolase [Pseudomonadota bacterium]